MADISKIKLGDETYNVKDARIVMGTAERDVPVTIEGTMVFFIAAELDSVSVIVSCPDRHATYLTEQTYVKVSRPDDTTYSYSGLDGGSNYIAIIKE